MNWREEAWKKKGSKLGDAPLKDAPKVAPSKAQDQAPTSSTSATVDMEREKDIIRLLNQKYSTSAVDTSKLGLENTGWTESLQKVVEQPSIVSAEFLPLEHLEETLRDKLESLADGNGCDPWEMILQIVTFYTDNEHDMADDGDIYQAVVSYLTNEVM